MFHHPFNRGRHLRPGRGRIESFHRLALMDTAILRSCPGRNRDRELVTYIARYGVVTIDHVMAALDVGRAAAYRRISACIEACLIERFGLLRLEPSLLRATSRGLAYAGLGLRKAMVSPGSLDHRLRCATTAQILAEEFRTAAVLPERDLLLLERTEGLPIAAARLLGQPHFHRPDLAVLTEGQTIAIELELSPKGPRRLAPIIAAWQKAASVSAVRYYVEPGPTRRGVERAVEKVRASDRIQILEAPPR